MVDRRKKISGLEMGIESVSGDRSEIRERRSHVDRRLFSYDGHLPERRSGKDRRRESAHMRKDARPLAGTRGLRFPLFLRE